MAAAPVARLEGTVVTGAGTTDFLVPMTLSKTPAPTLRDISVFLSPVAEASSSLESRRPSLSSSSFLFVRIRL